MDTEQVVIIGAGPAGMTAALQLQRYGIPHVLLEKEKPGGLLWNANLVENYPGFPKGIKGPKLVGLIERQLASAGVMVTKATVTQLVREKPGFRVVTSEQEFRPHFVLVASGTRSNPFPVEVPETARSRVFSEVSPLLGETGKRILIVGAGDAAFDYALNLTKNRNSVTILNRGEQVKCLRLLWARANQEPRVGYRVGVNVTEVALDKQSYQLDVGLSGGERLQCDYLLFAIGRRPQTSFITPAILDREADGLYYAGDVRNNLYRQTAIAAGDGLRAAMQIYFRLQSEVLS